MITWIIRILFYIIAIPLFMSAHWIWGIIFLIIGTYLTITDQTGELI